MDSSPKYHYTKIRIIKIINILPYVGMKYFEETEKMPMAVAKRWWQGKSHICSDYFILLFFFYSRINLFFFFLNYQISYLGLITSNSFLFQLQFTFNVILY